jgi:hypothetical protein
VHENASVVHRLLARTTLVNKLFKDH